MHRSIELARNGLGKVAPNPMVGCVIVSNDKIIGEGYHRQYGEAHAEVNAINSVKDKENLKTATLYVNLEPCAHHGKTPPCTDLILKHKIPKIIIGCVDGSKVSGKGIEKLKRAGCNVITGILENEARALNERFFTFYEKKRPYIILKWAQTMDGFITNGKGEPNRISNELSHTLVHKWRSEEGAIMVGTNTAHLDNPQLNVREWSGKNPLRVVPDRTLRLSKNLHLFDKSTPTVVFTSFNEKATQEKAKLHPPSFDFSQDTPPDCRQARLQGGLKYEKNLEYVNINFKKNIIPQILEELYKREIQSIIIEGGSQLLHSFLKNDSWDEMRVFISNKIFGNGIKAPELPSMPPIQDAQEVLPYKNSNLEFKKEDIAGDELLIFSNKQ